MPASFSAASSTDSTDMFSPTGMAPSSYQAMGEKVLVPSFVLGTSLTVPHGGRVPFVLVTTLTEPSSSARVCRKIAADEQVARRRCNAVGAVPAHRTHHCIWLHNTERLQYSHAIIGRSERAVMHSGSACSNHGTASSLTSSGSFAAVSLSPPSPSPSSGGLQPRSPGRSPFAPSPSLPRRSRTRGHRFPP